MGYFGHNQIGPFSFVFQDSRGCSGFQTRESVSRGVERSSAPIDLCRDTIGHDMKPIVKISADEASGVVGGPSIATKTVKQAQFANFLIDRV